MTEKQIDLEIQNEKERLDLINKKPHRDEFDSIDDYTKAFKEWYDQYMKQ